MLLNLHKKNWTEGLKLKDWDHMKVSNEESIKVRPLSLSFPLLLILVNVAHAPLESDIHCISQGRGDSHPAAAQDTACGEAGS